jgi:hypothetical protein
MSRAAGLAARPPALVEGEDDALVDGAAFQLAVGLGGLLHGHGCVRAQAEPAVSQQGIVSSRASGARSLVGSESVPPNSSSVPPLVTFSCRRTPTAASAELGSAAASIHETVSGLPVQINATA